MRKKPQTKSNSLRNINCADFNLVLRNKYSATATKSAGQVLALQVDIHEECVNTCIVMTDLLFSVSLMRVVVMDDCNPALYVI